MRASRAGIILAGGQSRRMGRSKALLELDSEPLLSHVARALLPSCEEIVLSVANQALAPIGFVRELEEAVRRTGAEVRIARDATPDLGPISGLAAALAMTDARVAFVSGCDSPFLRPDLVQSLLERIEEPPGVDAVIPRRDGHLEPLLAAYRVTPLLRHFRHRLSQGGGPITRGFSELRVREVSGVALEELDPDGASFANINTPGEYKRALERIAPSG